MNNVTGFFMCYILILCTRASAYNIIVHNVFTQAEGDHGRGGYPRDYEDIFNCIYPPEEWEENGKTWRRLANMNPATRDDVISLNSELWHHMSYWQARTQGLCRIRRELFSQCFGLSRMYNEGRGR